MEGQEDALQGYLQDSSPEQRPGVFAAPQDNGQPERCALWFPSFSVSKPCAHFPTFFVVLKRFGGVFSTLTQTWGLLCPLCFVKRWEQPQEQTLPPQAASFVFLLLAPKPAPAKTQASAGPAITQRGKRAQEQGTETHWDAEEKQQQGESLGHWIGLAQAVL